MANNDSRDARPSNGTDHVLVGCKLPHGLWLEIINVQPNPPPGLPPNMNPLPAGPRIKLNGANSVQQQGLITRVQPLVLEYGKTVVPREHWERWLAWNKDRDFIKNGSVFVIENARDQRSFNAQAAEKLPEKTGFEGLSPDGKDERMKKIAIPGQPETRIETDAAQVERLQRELRSAAA
jgi:hypothetical protein